jgi:hypothetical protein
MSIDLIDQEKARELTAAEQDALGSFWRVYGPRFEEIASEVQRDVESHPESGAFAGASPGSPRLA